MNKLLDFDKKYLDNYKIIAGIDEAGRGPVAGPLVVAVVVLDYNKEYAYINDSKKLSEAQRYRALTSILTNALYYDFCIIDNHEIDRINILNATKKCILKLIEYLPDWVDFVLIDHVKVNSSKNVESITYGDSLSLSIAAASILAKTKRDEIMKNFDLIYPQYGFKNHKGYLTKEHKEAIMKYGLCEIHRFSYSLNIDHEP